jgi:hypothetical protein
MANLTERYRELIAWAQLYLFQNFQEDEKPFVGEEEYRFFREWALQQKLANKMASAGTSPSPAAKPPIYTEERKTVRPAPPPVIQETPKAPDNVVNRLTPDPKPAPIPVAEPKKREANKKPPAAPSEEKPPFFVLDPPSKRSPPDFSALKMTLKECFPELVLLDQVPDDQEAKSKAAQWKEKQQDLTAFQLLFLSGGLPSKQQAFLSRICATLAQYQVRAGLIDAHETERKEGWGSLLSLPRLRLAVVCSYQLQQLPGLLKHYREEERHARYFFGKIPALLLPDLSVYFKEPSLKATLWKTLQSYL